MAGNFTAPDPLNNNAKTLSIYITELQDCVNTHREEINQVAVTFIVQNIGKKMSLRAIEELKTRTEQLALDFGYVGGIENALLLGRDWIEITQIKGVKVTSFPIINDLRQVLEALVVQDLFPLIIPVVSETFQSGDDFNVSRGGFYARVSPHDSGNGVTVGSISGHFSNSINPIHAIEDEGFIEASNPNTSTIILRPGSGGATFINGPSGVISNENDVCSDDRFFYILGNNIIVSISRTGLPDQVTTISENIPGVFPHINFNQIVSDKDTLYAVGEYDDGTGELADGNPNPVGYLASFAKQLDGSVIPKNTIQVKIEMEQPTISEHIGGTIFQETLLTALTIDDTKLYSTYTYTYLFDRFTGEPLPQGFGSGTSLPDPEGFAQSGGSIFLLINNGGLSNSYFPEGLGNPLIWSWRLTGPGNWYEATGASNSAVAIISKGLDVGLGVATGGRDLRTVGNIVAHGDFLYLMNEIIQGGNEKRGLTVRSKSGGLLASHDTILSADGQIEFLLKDIMFVPPLGFGFRVNDGSITSKDENANSLNDIPLSPESAFATNIGSTSFTANWTEPPSETTLYSGYRVSVFETIAEGSTTPVGEAVTIVDVPFDVQDIVIPDLLPEGNYVFDVNTLSGIAPQVSLLPTTSIALRMLL